MTGATTPGLAHHLWARNADRAAQALAHPFVRGLADGTLPGTSFLSYVAQDAFFLEAFSRAYGFGLAHSPDRASLDTFAALIGGVQEELQLHAAYAEERGINLATVRPTAATSAYTEFLLTIAAGGDVGLTCAALTPCMRLYAHLGQALSPASDPTYARWVETYANPRFEGLAATLERLLDRHGVDGARARATYDRAMRLELQFFDAAIT